MQSGTGWRHWRRRDEGQMGRAVTSGFVVAGDRGRETGVLSSQSWKCAVHEQPAYIVRGLLVCLLVA